MDTQKWAASLIKEVGSKWQEFKEMDRTFNAGYAVFYSPLRARPKLMIIGYNPGGTEADFDPVKNSRLPEVHDYLTEPPYRLAKKMRSLFNGIGGREALENSVKLNLIFFRTPDVRTWMSIDKTLREQAEAFCYNKVKEIVQTLQPKTILAEGLGTFNQLCQVLDLPKAHDRIRLGARILGCRVSTADHQVIGLIHPSGARIKNAEWTFLEQTVAKLVA